VHDETASPARQAQGQSVGAFLEEHHEPIAAGGPIWIAIGAIVAAGVGIMLSVSSGKPTVTEELEK